MEPTKTGVGAGKSSGLGGQVGVGAGTPGLNELETGGRKERDPIADLLAGLEGLDAGGANGANGASGAETPGQLV